MLNRYSTTSTTKNQLKLLERLTNVHPAGPDRWQATCPAHGTGKNKALSIRVTNDRILLHCFGGCTPERVLEALGFNGWSDLYAGSGLPSLYTRGRPLDSPAYHRPLSTLGAGPAPTPKWPTEERIQRWKEWWDRASTDHSILRQYLRSRGLVVEPPQALRLGLWRNQPVMLARVQDATGAMRAMHLTFLHGPGLDGKWNKEKILAQGSRPSGGAIQLYGLEPTQPLAVCEGIETGLAVHQATGWPVWACVSAGGLASVQLPPQAGEVVVCADNDQAGLKAAKKLVWRLLSEGRRVRLAVPPVAGADWLDMLHITTPEVA